MRKFEKISTNFTNFPVEVFPDGGDDMAKEGGGGHEVVVTVVDVVGGDMETDW